MKKSIIIAVGLLCVLTLFLFNACGNVNTLGDRHFSEDGYFIADSTDTTSFVLSPPSQIKFYVEVSGSMNGFFRANKPTHFKADVWQILSYYSQISPDVTILTNDGNAGASISMSDFRTKMNTGAFVSSASTRVPLMLQSIMDNLQPDEGEVAVLISDMKYSPVGAAAPDVLLTQYSTDISKILGNDGKAVSLIGATSDYLDKSGNSMTDSSPYYFFIIGNGEQVASVRNVISSLLQMSKHFIDNIDSGFDYGQVSCTFGIPDGCFQLEEEPTFVDMQEDTCTIQMKVNLENYRWIMTNPEIFAQAFEAKALYGSNVSVGNVKFDVQNITNQEGTNLLVRKATAFVELKVYDLALESEVIEWSLALPDTEISLFAPYFGATDENDVTKSYSIDSFITGIFKGGVVNKSLKPNYILISKNQ